MEDETPKPTTVGGSILVKNSGHTQPSDLALPPNRRSTESKNCGTHHLYHPRSSRSPFKPQPLERQSGIHGIQGFDTHYPGLLRQPDPSPTSEGQLARRIYAELEIVEDECININSTQTATVTDGNRAHNFKLGTDHWKAILNRHEILLHKYYDFFSETQHPSAAPNLKQLPFTHCMPARMWKRGIQSPLQLLCRQLPGSVDCMLEFLHMAYQVLTLFYEGIKAFEDTWIEYLGDLARYRMNIEPDVRDRETWAGALGRHR